MKGYTGVLADGQAVHYVDKKRWLWLLSVVYPLQPFISIGLHAKTGVEAWFLLPFFWKLCHRTVARLVARRRQQ